MTAQIGLPHRFFPCTAEPVRTWRTRSATCVVSSMKTSAWRCGAPQHGTGSDPNLISLARLAPTSTAARAQMVMIVLATIVEVFGGRRAVFPAAPVARDRMDQGIGPATGTMHVARRQDVARRIAGLIEHGLRAIQLRRWWSYQAVSSCASCVSLRDGREQATEPHRRLPAKSSIRTLPRQCDAATLLRDRTGSPMCSCRSARPGEVQPRRRARLAR